MPNHIHCDIESAMRHRAGVQHGVDNRSLYSNGVRYRKRYQRSSSVDYSNKVYEDNYNNKINTNRANSG